MSRRPRLTAEAYLAGILAGDRAVLSRAITLVESTLADDQARAAALLNLCLQAQVERKIGGNSIRLGITGPPGVGKSTFIEGFGLMLTKQGLRVAVLAVDPSSQRTGGSILGDKTRMNELATHQLAFIRPSPSGHSLGGVGRSTREAIVLCETAGFDCIIVETVGVGQSETLVASMVDYFLLLLLPGAGDDLQGIKRGIMEMAQGIAINKADGAMLPVARQAHRDVEQSLRLLPPDATGHKTELFLCSGYTGDGVQNIWQNILAFKEKAKRDGQWLAKRNAQLLSWFQQATEERWLQRLKGHSEVAFKLKILGERVARGQVSLSAALVQVDSIFEMLSQDATH